MLGLAAIGRPQLLVQLGLIKDSSTPRRRERVAPKQPARWDRTEHLQTTHPWVQHGMPMKSRLVITMSLGAVRMFWASFWSSENSKSSLKLGVVLFVSCEWCEAGLLVRWLSCRWSKVPILQFQSPNPRFKLQKMRQTCRSEEASIQKRSRKFDIKKPKTIHQKASTSP